MDGDALRSVRNAFYLGLYSEVQKEAAQLNKQDKELQAWGDVYVARAAMCANPATFQASPNAPTAIQAIKQLAKYLTLEGEAQSSVLTTLGEWLSSPDLSKDVTLQLMAAHVYLASGRIKDALALVANDAENLEKLSLSIILYLRIDRIDLAAKCLKAMQDLDDDDTLTQLAATWMGVAQGGEKVTEAAFLLQELLEKFGPSVIVLNCLAVCDIHLRNYTGAFQFTKQARELSIKSGQKVSADTLLNSIVCLQHLRKGEEILQKIEAELKTTYPAHPWIRKQKDMDELFQRHADTYAAKQ